MSLPDVSREYMATIHDECMRLTNEHRANVRRQNVYQLDHKPPETSRRVWDLKRHAADRAVADSGQRLAKAWERYNREINRRGDGIA